jgi:hypothetical protein
MALETNRSRTGSDVMKRVRDCGEAHEQRGAGLFRIDATRLARIFCKEARAELLCIGGSYLTAEGMEF